MRLIDQDETQSKTILLAVNLDYFDEGGKRNRFNVEFIFRAICDVYILR